MWVTDSAKDSWRSIPNANDSKWQSTVTAREKLPMTAHSSSQWQKLSFAKDNAWQVPMTANASRDKSHGTGREERLDKFLPHYKCQARYPLSDTNDTYNRLGTEPRRCIAIGIPWLTLMEGRTLSNNFLQYDKYSPLYLPSDMIKTISRWRWYVMVYSLKNVVLTPYVVNPSIF